MPLADKIRPQTLDDVVGQSHLLNKDKPLRRIIEGGSIPNMIFYGPSGVGKTTIASIIAKQTNMSLYKLNGTSTSTADIKEIIGDINSFSGSNGILLYLDEIQYLNKKQQQSLLQYIENGDITLIASTTENPYFYIYNAILSRCTVFQFKEVTPLELVPAIKRAFLAENATVTDEVITYISMHCGGDVRKAINAAELCVLSAIDGDITLSLAELLTQKSNMKYDRSGDEHYDILSAFQKSIRGSDENAALHYLAKLILADDLPSICRRLLVIASEDIGLAYPLAAVITKSCVDSALQLGFPEARIPLAEAVILLATSPKSNSVITAIDAALGDVSNGGAVPPNIKDGHYSGAKKLGNALEYKYPHDFPNHYVKQQYLPDSIKDAVYYRFSDNKFEQAAATFRENQRETPS